MESWTCHQTVCTTALHASRSPPDAGSNHRPNDGDGARNDPPCSDPLGSGAREGTSGAATRGGGCGRPHVHVELDGSVRPVHAGRLPQHVAGGHPEPARAADDGELPHVRRDVVPAHHRERAAVVVPRGEQQVGAHHEHDARLRRHHVEALSAAHGGGRGRRRLRQRVVDHRGVAERQPRDDRRPRALDHLHRRRVAPGHHVVHEEVQVRGAVVVRRQDG
uniref:Uncharacterized protein n=1 Tax=Zea mays TaxID=4577 RepID=A0A804MX34_MAIZE